MKYNYNDGGRSAAGFRGATNDCVTRAISIVTKKPYKKIYDLINDHCNQGPTYAYSGKPVYYAYKGVPASITNAILKKYGYEWISLAGHNVFLVDFKPKGARRVIVRVHRHLTAYVNGMIQDTYDCSKKHKAIVIGYWRKKKVEKSPVKLITKKASPKKHIVLPTESISEFNKFLLLDLSAMSIDQLNDIKKAARREMYVKKSC